MPSEFFKPQKTIVRETRRIAIGVGILLCVMLAVFAALGRMSLSVVLGGVMGAVCAVGNFYLLGLSVQRMASTDNEELARMQMRTSYQTRMLGMVILMVIAFAVPFIDGLSALIPLIFPRLTILFLQLTGRIKDE